MIARSNRLAVIVVFLFSLSSAEAQQERQVEPQSPAPVVTATASAEHIRYASLGEVHQTRLQVFSPDGSQVFDSGFRLGNLIDWRLTDQQGAHLSDSSYFFLVTVKDFSARLTQKYGTAVLEEGQVYLEQGSRDSLTPPQATALEANRLSEALSTVDRVGVAALGRANTASTSGALQTPSAETKRTTEMAAAAPGEVDATGTGSQNMIAKWTDGGGTLGDSIMFDNGSGVGVGTTDLTDVLVAGNDKFKIVDGPMTFSFRDFASGQGYFAVGSTNGIKGFIGHTNVNDGFTLGSFSNHKLTIRTNSVNRLTIDTNGNVGIGTPSPIYRLDVNGTMRAMRDVSTDAVVQTTGGTNAWARFWMITPSQGWAMGTSQNFNGNQFYLNDQTFQHSRMTIQPNGGPIAFPLGHVLLGPGSPGLLSGSTGKMMEIRDTFSPGLALTHTGTGGNQFFLYSRADGFAGTGSFRIYDATNVIDRFVLNNAGNVGLGYINPTTNLHVERPGQVEALLRSPNERAVLSLDSTLQGQRKVWTLESGFAGLPGLFAIYNRTDNRVGLTIDGGGRMFVNGHAGQSLNSGGMAKFMIRVNPFNPAGSQITACYNSQEPDGGASLPGCGFTAQGVAVGQWRVSFGHNITGRFPVASINNDNSSAFPPIVPLVVNNGTYFDVFLRYTTNFDNSTNAIFTLIVF